MRGEPGEWHLSFSRQRYAKENIKEVRLLCVLQVFWISVSLFIQGTQSSQPDMWCSRIRWGRGIDSKQFPKTDKERGKETKRGMGKPPSVEEIITVKDLSTCNGPHPREQFCNQDDRQNAHDDYKSVSPHWLNGLLFPWWRVYAFFFFFASVEPNLTPKGHHNHWEPFFYLLTWVCGS